MKLRMRSAVLMLPVLGAILWGSVAPASAVTFDPAVSVNGQAQELDPESIAQRSLSVAETMRSSGWCYTGVSKALSPLGVTLTGSAAYQAREQLLADSRFMPVSQDDIVGLRRGDIIVFDKSATHPYGHICVYQGNDEESSDHVSHLTTPGAYGGVTVFRLRSENNEIAGNEERRQWNFKAPLSAPDFRRTNSSCDYTEAMQANAPHYGQGDTKSSGSTRGAAEFARREFRILSNSPEGKSLAHRLIRFVMRNL